jgi:hypothetical protein
MGVDHRVHQVRSRRIPGPKKAGRAGVLMVARGGVEPPTYRFSGGRSYQLSYLAVPVSERGEVYRTSSRGPVVAACPAS